MTTEQTDLELKNVFEERAEYLSRSDLELWTQRTAGDLKILAKLKGPGAKLLTGPRGSGKSTLLREAYFDLLDRRDAMPAYVNYAKSLALEPLFHRAPNAIQVFRQWVVMKVIEAVGVTFDDLGASVPVDLVLLLRQASDYIYARSALVRTLPRSIAWSPLRNYAHCSTSGRLHVDDGAPSSCWMMPRMSFPPSSNESSSRYIGNSGPGLWRRRRPYIPVSRPTHPICMSGTRRSWWRLGTDQTPRTSLRQCVAS